MIKAKIDVYVLMNEIGLGCRRKSSLHSVDITDATLSFYLILVCTRVGLHPISPSIGMELILMAGLNQYE